MTGDNVLYLAAHGQPGREVFEKLAEVFEKLAEETELADFLALVSKHPVFPTEAYHWNDLLQIKPDADANHVYEWGWDNGGR